MEDAVPLSETLVPIIVLKTNEIEYLGAPYTKCINDSTDLARPTITNNIPISTGYDISLCKMLPHVLAIIKMWCFHQLLSVRL